MDIVTIISFAGNKFKTLEPKYLKDLKIRRPNGRLIFNMEIAIRR